MLQLPFFVFIFVSVATQARRVQPGSDPALRLEGSSSERSDTKHVLKSDIRSEGVKFRRSSAEDLEFRRRTQAVQAHSLFEAQQAFEESMSQAIAARHNATPITQESLGNAVLKNPSSAGVRVCMQISVPYHVFGFITSTVDFGFSGIVRYRPETGCWGGRVDVELGVSVGFTHFGVDWMASITGAGFAEFDEVTETEALHIARGSNSSEAASVVASVPSGEPQNQCHSKSPWSALKAIWEQQTSKWLSGRHSTKAKAKAWEAAQRGNATAVAKNPVHIHLAKKLGQATTTTVGPVEEPTEADEEATEREWDEDGSAGQADADNVDLQDNVSETESAEGEEVLRDPAVAEAEDSFKREYVNLLESNDSSKVFHASRAMSTTYKYFSNALQSYASHILTRLVDNRHWFRGVDNERAWMGFRETLSTRRFRSGHGRFLARWPSKERAASHKANSNLKKSGLAGVEDVEEDMRVINFAKVARMSDDKSRAFWKMFGISVANLAVRVIGDIKALFGSFFAGDPHWDGACGSLRFPFRLSFIGSSNWFHRVRSYPWASAFMKPHQRISFIRGFRENTEQEESEENVVYPHLWCILANVAKPSADENLTISNFSLGPELTMTIPETCQTVLYAKRELAPQDSVRKDNISSRCVVEGGEWPGSLWSKTTHLFVRGDECNEAIARGIQANQFRVAKRVIEVLPECEVAAFPRVLHKIFPVLGARAARLIDQLSALLRKLNACLHETITHARAAMGVNLDHEITCRDAEVRGIALNMVRKVRAFLWRLGAVWPKGGHKNDQIPKRGRESQHDRQAELLRLMGKSFDIKVGLEGLQREPGTSSIVVGATASSTEDDSRKAVANADAEIKTLSGTWWQEFNRSKILQLVLRNRNPLLAARFFDVLYAPPVTVSIGVTLSARAVSSRFCERKPSLLEMHFILMRKWHTFSVVKKTRSCVVGKGSFHGVTVHARCCRVHNDNGEIEYELLFGGSVVAADFDLTGDLVSVALALPGGLSAVSAYANSQVSTKVNTDEGNQMAKLHEGLQSKLMQLASVALLAKSLMDPVMKTYNPVNGSMHDTVKSTLINMSKVAAENPNKFGDKVGLRGRVAVEVFAERTFPFWENTTEPTWRKGMFVNAISRVSSPLVSIGNLSLGGTVSGVLSWDVSSLLR
eukprot:TRINITY_DN12458_c0_g1_i3.p1 TRINITY_DN12458_c0_g1~~TRINITY_DN12458_c0_g1_i3.p1  ORF type:complete len:1160 (+),score=173.15 TRINITY_DN12458_c0_g1_i3:40-3519(+)